MLRDYQRVICDKCSYGFSSNMPHAGQGCDQKGCTGTFQLYIHTSRVARLRITTWVGTSAIGARHYYGRIKFRDDEQELTYRISSKDARLLNESDPGAGYKAGDQSSRFESEEMLHRSAVLVFEKELLSKGCALLLGGDSCSPEPMIAFAPDAADAAARLEALYREFEEIDGYEGDEKRADELTESFSAIINQYEQD